MPERAKVIAAVQEAYDELSRPIGLRDVGEYGVTNLSRLEAEIADRLAGSDSTDEAPFTPAEYDRLGALVTFALSVNRTFQEADVGADAFAPLTVDELLGLQARLYAAGEG